MQDNAIQADGQYQAKVENAAEFGDFFADNPFIDEKDMEDK